MAAWTARSMRWVTRRTISRTPRKSAGSRSIDYCAKVVNPAGNICLIGVYMAPDPGAKDKQAKQGIYPLPIGELFDKAVTIGMGQCPVKKYNEYLRDLIIQGRAHPGKIVSHHIRIQEAPGRVREVRQARGRVQQGADPFRRGDGGLTERRNRDRAEADAKGGPPFSFRCSGSVGMKI